MTESETASQPLRLLPASATSTGTHRNLLEAALLLFGDRGFHGVSVRDIAEAAGIRAPSIYKHADSKQDLLLQLMVIGHEELRRRMRQALLESGTDSSGQLACLVRTHVLMHAQFPALARVCNRELHALTPGNAARVADIRRDGVDTFVAVIERGTAAGSFHVEDTWLATAAIAAMGIRVAEWWDRYPGYAPERVAETFARYALGVVGAKGVTAPQLRRAESVLTKQRKGGIVPPIG